MNWGTIAPIGGIRIVATRTPNRKRDPRAGSVAKAKPTIGRGDDRRDDAQRRDDDRVGDRAEARPAA